MTNKKLGRKHVCMDCGCKFYDLEQAPPVCPKCGTEQTEKTRKESAHGSRMPASSSSIYSSPPRTRQKKIKDDWGMDDSPFDNDEDEDKASDTIEDGLSVIDGDDIPDDEEDQD